MELIKRLDNFEILEEMAYRVGTTTDIYMIYVNSDDGGKIPHFHYVDAISMGKDRKKGFHTCIKITEASYFKHGNHTDELNSSQKKALHQFLSKPFKQSNFHITNWEFIVAAWNDNNSDVLVDESLAMPDYRNLS